MQTPTKLVCWDWNGTIEGRSFGRDLGSDYRGDLRANIADVMAELRVQGYANVVTSTIPESSIQFELKRFQLDGVIDRIFGNARSRNGSSKEYKNSVEAMQIPVNEAPARVAVIGDNEHDNPCDLEKVVFIYNPEGFDTDARIVQQLLYELDQRGNGSFYHGFETLKAKDVDLKKECGFSYHGQLALQGAHQGIVLSTFNGCPWATPTILLIPAQKALQFKQLEDR